jgi:signal transduction histidine kinase
VLFAIADDGAGIAGPVPRNGDGLTGMRDRIGAVGGELEIVSSPAAGTMVRGTIPLAEAAR